MREKETAEQKTRTVEMIKKKSCGHYKIFMHRMLKLTNQNQVFQQFLQ